LSTLRFRALTPHSDDWSSSNTIQRITAARPNFSRSRPTACSAGGAAQAALIDEIGRIGALRGSERADADADQAKSRRPGFARQQFAAGVKYLCRELSRRAERDGDFAMNTTAPENPKALKFSRS